MFGKHTVSLLGGDKGYTVSELCHGEGYTMKYSLYFVVFPDSSHNTNILNYISSIDLPERSILKDLNLRIASTAGQYGKILPSRLSNTWEVNFNIIMFSNWESIRIMTRGGMYGQIYPYVWRRKGIFDRISWVKFLYGQHIILTGIRLMITSLIKMNISLYTP